MVIIRLIEWIQRENGGGFVALEGMVNFAAGGMVGSIGNIGTKGAFLKSKEWWGKFVFGLEFTQPFKIGVDYMRHNVS